jgi:hypothetical protein
VFLSNLIGCTALGILTGLTLLANEHNPIVLVIGPAAGLACGVAFGWSDARRIRS